MSLDPEFEIHGRVRGTPRTYGNSRTEDAWRLAVVQGDWTGHEGIDFPLTCSLELQFDFAIHPYSSDYGAGAHPNGRDLDTLVVQSSTSAALLSGRNAQRPSLRWIHKPQLVRRLVARKRLVDATEAAGVEIAIRRFGSSAHLDRGVPALEFEVPESMRRETGLGEAVRQSVAIANRAQMTFSRLSRIALWLAFRDLPRPVNILSEELLEKTIDAMGAAPVGDRRLFAETPGSAPGRILDTDDSIVFELIVEKIDALPRGSVLCGKIWDLQS